MRRVPAGFSLVEVIVTLVLAGLLAVGIVTFFDRQIVGAYVPYQRMQNATQLSSAMEAVIRDYEGLSTKSSANLTGFASKVNNFSANYGTWCPTCNATASTVAVGSLSGQVLVAISNKAGETTYHLFTVQDY